MDGRKDFIDEVLQLLRVQLFAGPARKIASYTGRGPLERWRRSGSRSGRRSGPRGQIRASVSDASEVAAQTAVSEREAGAEQPFKAVYARAFERALEEAFRGLDPRERAVMRLHFSEGMNIDDIGRVQAVHRATVARWIASAREGLARSVRTRLEAQFGQLPQEEFDSLFQRGSGLPPSAARNGS